MRIANEVECIYLLFDDIINEKFYNPLTVALMLIVYGILFIIVENNKKSKIHNQISFLDAFKIGLFQVLSIIPGTSRSGATIVGGLSMGIDRTTIANFTFPPNFLCGVFC